MQRKSRLFPVFHKFGAICAAANPADDASLELYSRVSTRYRDELRGVDEASPGKQVPAAGNDIMILPNGYYFYHPAQADQKGSVVLGNLLMNSAVVKPIEVDSFLDISAITMLSNRKTEKILCGVSRDRKRLFAYAVVEPEGSGYGLRLIAHQQKDVNSVGACIFALADEDHRQITRFAGFNHPNDHLLAIGFNTGEITLSTFKPDYTVEKILTLQGKTEDFAQSQMLITPSGCLVAYSPSAEKLRIWDLANVKQFTEYVCPRLANLSASLDGKYLIACDMSHQPDPTLVHVFTLKPFKHQQLRMAMGVDDIVISGEGSVMAVKDNVKADRDDWGDVEIMNIGNVKKLLDKSHDVIPVVDQVNLSKKPHAGIKLKQLAQSKFSSIFRRHAEPAAVADKERNKEKEEDTVAVMKPQ